MLQHEAQIDQINTEHKESVAEMVWDMYKIIVAHRDKWDLAQIKVHLKLGVVRPLGPADTGTRTLRSSRNGAAS